MNSVISTCPVCQHHLHVTGLQCHNCDTRVEGHFALGRLYHLSPEQLSFVETFIRSEGKINRVESELGLSYPAVRARLTDVIRALGYEVGEESQQPLSEEERRAILADVAAGKLTSEEAVDLIRGAEK